MKPSILFFIVLYMFTFCKEKQVSVPQAEEEDPITILTERGCVPNPETNQTCLRKKEELSCYKTLEEVKKSKLDKIFFNQVWMGDDQQTLFYHIDSKGNLKIFEGGPDKLPHERRLIGSGKFFHDQNQWYYEQSCKTDVCENFKIPILYLDCALTTNFNNQGAVRIIEFGNHDNIDEEKIKNKKKYKVVTIVQEKAEPSQIFHYFISTPVPPIPSN
ncbi:hypothetical protein LEP1GSC202_2128 [Leptospira yanagawae serovar Saopaulo str. Sao Paulo = ATCC 700523]|uniref:Uncharacterized protein n=1 Tax=Leptospira yanagawae serovar Saopaulo str. Sao Paulo = ATCC 700523 TaxID=1249483 RepID=A0A5E8HAQ7_9LEPT|nr:hypothetical protein [Leptospira yanagawae]EOQ87818.1 hypothetical protein LEP1GSC202_2128 [Leptospira yanagawae serovar Saopaulo str. Sao Paulo = ATCC 700523]